MSQGVPSRQHDKRTAEWAVRRLDAVLSVTDVALANLPLDELLPALLDRVRTAMDVHNAALLLLDEQGDMLHVAAARGLEEEVAAGVRVPYGQGFAGRVASGRKPWVVDDVRTIEVVSPFLQQKLRSLVGVPLETAGRVIGVLHVGTAYAHHFSDEDVALLELVAERAARAIDAARLRESEHRLERGLAERAEQLERTFDALADGVMLYDRAGRIIQHNASVRKILGIEAVADYTTMPIADRAELLAVRDVHGHRLSADEMPPMRALRGEVLTGGQALDLFIRTLDGREIALSVSASPVRDTEGQINGSVVVYRDVTERRRLERAARENEQRYRAAFEQAAVGMAEVALDGRWLSVNEKLCQIVGYSHTDLLARTFQDITHPQDLQADLDLLGQLLSGDIPTYTMEKRYIHSGGSIVWINLTVSLVRDASGAPLYFISVVEDISARKAAEAERQASEVALRISEARQRTLIATLPQLIWTMSADGIIITFVNERWCTYAGRPASSLVGARFPAEIIHPDDRAQAVDARAQALATGVPLDYTLRYRRHDGVYHWHALRIEPVRDDVLGTITAWFGAATDIDELKRIQAELAVTNQTLERRVEQRTEQLQEVNDALKAFAYSVSHDLRAPLRAMDGFAQALAEDYSAVLDETAQMYTQRIVTAAARMDRLIQDLLAYSRLTREDIRLRPVDLEAVVQDVLELLSGDIRARGAQVHVSHPLPRVVGNLSILRQVVGNLVGNALLYVAPNVVPQVRISAESYPKAKAQAAEPATTARGDEGVAQVARLWIEDNGIGIASQHQERIFSVFERLHGIEAYPGTGIGLAIVKKGAERVGGQVGLESALGVGSRFWIELPLVAPGAVPTVPARADELEV